MEVQKVAQKLGGTTLYLVRMQAGDVLTAQQDCILAMH